MILRERFNSDSPADKSGVTAYRLHVEMNFHAVTKSLLKQTVPT